MLLSKDNVSRRRVAAIDVGTNSIHCLIAEMDQYGNMTPVESTKDQVRLGESLDERLLLNASALEKASNSLRRMKTLAQGHGAVLRVIGTHILREAKNGRDFCSRLFKKTGVIVEVVPGQEEARLVYLGVQNGLPIYQKSTLIVDIGGGSTEFLVGQWGEQRFSTSLKLGTVRLTTKYIKDEVLSPEGLQEMRHYIRTRLEPVLAEIRKVGFEMAVCTSGTVKAIKAVALGIQGKPLPSSFHGVTLSLEEIGLVRAAVEQTTSIRERKQIPNLDSKRADIIVAGVEILEAISIAGEVSEWFISLSGIREGLVLDTLVREEHWLKGDLTDVRWRSVRGFGHKFEIEEAHAWHISSLALSLFSQLSSRHGLGSPWKEYLRASAYLHECGRYLSFTGFHKHGFYVLRNSYLPGFSTHELDLIACTIRFHRKRLPKASDDVFGEFDRDEQRAVNICASILRLAAALDRGRQGKIQDIRVVENADTIRVFLHLRGTQDIGLELYQSEMEKHHCEQALGVSFAFEVEKSPPLSQKVK